MIGGELTLVLLRGDHPLAEQKLADATGAGDIRPAQADEIREALGASPGSLGAVGVTDLPVIADLALQGRRNMTTGANIDDVHLTGVDVARDIAVGRWADLREVRAGEPCPRCGAPLEIIRAIEVGHIFKLGRKYTTALGVSVLGPDGASIIPIMGSYGIGVERAMAAIAEVHHDDAGPGPGRCQVAPGRGDRAAAVAEGRGGARAAAEALYAELQAAGVDTLIDDRDERPGVKFRDAELIGIPCRVSVGSRDLADGVVEITSRSDRREGAGAGGSGGHARAAGPVRPGALPQPQASPEPGDSRGGRGRAWRTVSAPGRRAAAATTRSLWLASALQSWLLLDIEPPVCRMTARVVPRRHIRHV